MKKITLLLLFVFGINSAFADCASAGMQFYPSQKEISLNSMFIIEGYGMSQKTIESFKNRSIYLESENGTLIELELQEVLKGQMRLTQAIFKPSKALEPHTTYYLKYSNQTEQEVREMTRYNRETEKHERVSWKTTDKISAEALNSNLSLEFEMTKVVHFGCGPEANAIFKVENKGTQEIWYKTEVLDLATNEKSVYYIKEWNGKLNVGHDMCSGGFTFHRKGNYKVRFTPMNTDGNVLTTTDWTSFESPHQNDPWFEEG